MLRTLWQIYATKIFQITNKENEVDSFLCRMDLYYWINNSFNKMKEKIYQKLRKYRYAVKMAVYKYYSMCSYSWREVDAFGVLFGTIISPLAIPVIFILFLIKKTVKTALSPFEGIAKWINSFNKYY